MHTGTPDEGEEHCLSKKPHKPLCSPKTNFTLKARIDEIGDRQTDRQADKLKRTDFLAAVKRFRSQWV